MSFGAKRTPMREMIVQAFPCECGEALVHLDRCVALRWDDIEKFAQDVVAWTAFDLGVKYGRALTPTEES